MARGGSPVGRSEPRENARRLVTGRGRYTEDFISPGTLHAAILRSPVANGTIRTLDVEPARRVQGVVAVLTGAEVARVCRPLQVVLDHVPGHLSPPQPVLATESVRWVGEPVAIALASSRAVAEDALDAILLEIDEIAPITSIADSLGADAPSANGLPSGNLAFRMPLDNARPDAPAPGTISISQVMRFGRVTALPLEGRAVIADYSPGDGSLRIVQSHQAPHLAQAVYAELFDIPEHLVSVTAPDVGGAFGMKMHFYPDELAAIAASRLLARPVRLVVDRVEGLLSDSHAREAEIEASLVLAEGGVPALFDAKVRTGIGAYSIYVRSSIGDAVQALTLMGAPYRIGRLSGEAVMAYQNKAPTGAIRGVGQPLACAATEVMIDHAARALGEDPAAYRRRCYLRDEDFPGRTLGGYALDRISLRECHDELLRLIDYPGLRADQADARRRRIYRGIGLAAFVEQTAVGAALYGPSGLPVSAQETVSVRLEPSGDLRVEAGATEQGQGTLTGIAQIVAAAFGVEAGRVSVASGRSAGSYGGGTWASRGLAIAGEAAYAAANRLRDEVLMLAGAILQVPAASLHVADGQIRDAGGMRLTVREVARIGYFGQETLPPGIQPQLTVIRSHVPRAYPYAMANGIQASHLEIDVETGFIRLLGHWVVEDCGRIVNPQLVDEQLRGGIVNGIGNALFEECRYDETGQMVAATMADYLVPMAGDVPDIGVRHLETLQSGSELGIKGSGEAGSVGAMAAVWCAANDALAPLGAVLEDAPFTPERVIAAVAAGK